MHDVVAAWMSSEEKFVTTDRFVHKKQDGGVFWGFYSN